MWFMLTLWKWSSFRVQVWMPSCYASIRSYWVDLANLNCAMLWSEACTLQLELIVNVWQSQWSIICTITMKTATCFLYQNLFGLLLLSFFPKGFWAAGNSHWPATGHMEQHGEEHRLQSNTGQLPLQICRWAGQKVLHTHLLHYHMC